MDPNPDSPKIEPSKNAIKMVIKVKELD